MGLPGTASVGISNDSVSSRASGCGLLFDKVRRCRRTVQTRVDEGLESS